MKSKLIYVFLLTGIFILTQEIFSQEKPNSDEMKELLSILPAMEYDSLQFLDKRVFSNSSSSDYMGKLMRREADRLPVPISVLATSSIIINAKAVEYIQNDEEKELSIGSLSPIHVSAKDTEGNQIEAKLICIVREFYIFKTNDAEFVLSKSLKSGKIKSTDHSIQNYRIYSYEHKNMPYFISQLDQENILVSTDFRMLKKVFDAYLGGSESISETEEFKEVAEVIPENSSMWMITSSTSRLRAELEYLKERNANQKYIDHLEQQISETPVNTISYFNFDEENVISNFMIGVFTDEESAAKAYTKEKDRTGNTRNPSNLDASFYREENRLVMVRKMPIPTSKQE